MSSWSIWIGFTTETDSARLAEVKKPAFRGGRPAAVILPLDDLESPGGTLAVLADHDVVPSFATVGTKGPN
jgi:hypothetical protein